MRAKFMYSGLENLRNVQRPTHRLRNSIDQRGALALLVQGALHLLPLSDVTGNTLYANRFAIAIDQSAAEFEWKSFSGLSDNLGLINRRRFATLDLAREVLANGIDVFGRHYLGNVHSERFRSRIT